LPHGAPVGVRLQAVDSTRPTTPPCRWFSYTYAVRRETFEPASLRGFIPLWLAESERLCPEGVPRGAISYEDLETGQRFQFTGFRDSDWTKVMAMNDESNEVGHTASAWMAAVITDIDRVPNVVLMRNRRGPRGARSTRRG
jgi:hypothetical protein